MAADHLATGAGWLQPVAEPAGGHSQSSDRSDSHNSRSAAATANAAPGYSNLSRAASGPGENGVGHERVGGAPKRTEAKQGGLGGAPQAGKGANLSIGAFRASGHESPEGSHTDEVDKREQPEGGLKQFLKMARGHYLASLLCLSVVLVAGLLATVAISRTIGGLDLDAEGAGAGATRASPAESQTGEPMEVRQLELVDLVECDKTFAYVSWRVMVRVPRSAPHYKQQRAPNSAQNRRARQVDTVHNSQAATQAEMPRDAIEDEQQQQQYHLAGTREFVASHARNNSQAGADSARVDSSSTPVEGVALALGLFEGAPEPVDLDDPLELAASELGVESSELNSTLADCFLVDLQKRPGQRQALEREHGKLAPTRVVGFRGMLAIIQACRELTMRTLVDTEASSLISGAKQAAANSASDDTRRRRATNSSGGTTDQHHRDGQLSALTANQDEPMARARPESERLLSESIVPSGPAVAHESAHAESGSSRLGSLIEILVANWSSRANDKPAGPAALESRRASNAVQPGAPLPPSPVLPLVKAEEGDDEEARRRASYLNMGMSMMSGIVPNTLWCGLGDRAANYSELGAEFQIDACCRAHDHCPVRLRPFAADYNLINWSMSTRSHCACDLDFSDCLATVNSSLSNVIKTLYFRFIGLQCIDLELASRGGAAPTQTPAAQ